MLSNVELIYLNEESLSLEWHRNLMYHFCICKCVSINLFWIWIWIWPIFTGVIRPFDTGYPVHVSLLPLCFVCLRNSVYFLVCFPLFDERTWVARQENSIGADGESLLTTQPSHILWDYKIYTRYLIYPFSAIQPSCLHSLNGHYPHCSIYPHPCW